MLLFVQKIHFLVNAIYVLYIAKFHKLPTHLVEQLSLKDGKKKRKETILPATVAQVFTLELT